jgi:hypothetical protein
MTTQFAAPASRTASTPFDEAASLVTRLDDEIGRVIIGQQRSDARFSPASSPADTACFAACRVSPRRC